MEPTRKVLDTSNKWLGDRRRLKRQCSQLTTTNNNHLGIKQLALLISISLYAVVVTLLSVTAFVTFDTDEYIRVMEDYARDYQWDRKPGEEPNKATHFWDGLQRDLHCCGLNGPWDWRRWSHQSVLPDSCCPRLPDRLVSNIYDRGGCHAYNAFDGCTKSIENMVMVLAGSGWFLLLAAILVAKEFVPNKAGRRARQCESCRSAYMHQPFLDEESRSKSCPVDR